MSRRELLHERSSNLPPPRVNHKKRTIEGPIPPSTRRKSSQNASPSATQALLQDNLDDFFPTPSQALRELGDDVDIPSNTQIAREIECSPSLQPDPEELVHGHFSTRGLNDRLASTQELDDSLVSTQRLNDCLVSTQELDDRLANTQELNDCLASTQELDDALVSTQMLDDCLVSTQELDDSLVSTQRPDDCLLSTQELILPLSDVLELAPYSSPPHGTKASSAPKPSRPRQRFFEEKEEDILHAILHESKVMAQKAGTGVETEDDPERQLQAVLRESALMSATDNKAVEQEGVSVRLGSSEKRRRAGLQRVLSSTTDYGDEEMEDEEWMALG